MFSLIFILLSVNLNCNVQSASNNNSDCNKLYETYYDDSLQYFKVMKNTLVLKNFNSYEELYLKCSLNISNKALIYLPNKELLLDNSMDYKRLFSHIIFEQSFNEIIFFKVKGFNYKQSQISSFNFINNTVSLMYGSFSFYINDAKIDENLCDIDYFKKQKFFSNFFGNILTLLIIKGVKYSTKTCPYVFVNSKINHLFLGQISNSLILKNRIEFIEVNQTKGFDLNNKRILILNLALAYETVTTKVVDKYVFKYLKHLGLFGIISEIEEDLFKNLEKLTSIRINTESLVRLLSNNNKWINNINSYVKVNLANKIKVTFYFKEALSLIIE